MSRFLSDGRAINRAILCQPDRQAHGAELLAVVIEGVPVLSK
jgi:hypothetical protein